MHIKTQSRVVVATLAAAMAITAIDMRPVAAAEAVPQKAEAVKTAQASDATEFSSQHRYYRHGGYRRGNAAAAAAIVGTFGVVAGIAAAERSRRYYRDGYYDYGYGAPAYGYAEPYAPAPYYAPSYYGPRNEYFPN